MLKLFKPRKQPESGIDRTRSVLDTRYVVIDTELTGLHERKDAIISMAAVRMTGTTIELGSTFRRLIKPEAGFNPESVTVHGITPSDVSMQPRIDSVLMEFLDFCGSDVIVGHCVSIDLSFINREMKRISGGPMQNPAIDTYMMHEWLRKKVIPAHPCFSRSPKGSALYDMAQCFGIAVRGAHDAAVDSFITAQLFQRFIPIFIDAGVQQIGDLLSIGHPSEGGGRLRGSGEISYL
jgi:DNA polymerase-3 subunit epsilon